MQSKGIYYVMNSENISKPRGWSKQSECNGTDRFSKHLTNEVKASHAHSWVAPCKTLWFLFEKKLIKKKPRGECGTAGWAQPLCLLTLPGSDFTPQLIKPS